MKMNHRISIAALVGLTVGLSFPAPSYAQFDSCTYVVMEAEGACPGIIAEGTAVCTACRIGKLCSASLECTSTFSSCSLRMLARVQELTCDDCPIGANQLPPGFNCVDLNVQPTETPDGGGGTPTPTATDDGSGGTPTPTDDGSGGTPTPTDDGSGGTPTPTDDGSGGTPTPTDDGSGGTPTPTEDTSGGTPTPTEDTSGGTPTRTATTTRSGGTVTPTRTPTLGVATATATTRPTTPNTVTPTRTTGVTAPPTTVSTNTPVRTATSGTPAATRTATNGSSGDDHHGDDGCQVVAPAQGEASWMLLVAALGFVAWRRFKTSEM